MKVSSQMDLLLYIAENILSYMICKFLYIIPLTSMKLREHIVLGLSICLSVPVAVLATEWLETGS